MEYWFRLHKIPKEEKLGCALSMLDGEAYEWWLKEDAATYYTSRAVLDWGTLKDRMYGEFTRKYRTTPRKVEALKPRAKENVREAKTFSKSAHNSWSMEVPPISVKKTPKPSNIASQVATTTASQQVPKQGTLEDGKTSNTLSSTEVICYRCQGSGHKAKECPTRRLVAETHSAQEVNCAKISDDFVKSDFMIPTSCITHLSCVKGIDKSVGNQGESKGQDEQVHGKRNSKVDTYEPENTQVKEVDKSGQDVETENEHIKEDVGNLEEVVNSPEIGELMETSDDQGPLVEPTTFQDDNSHNKCLVTTEQSDQLVFNNMWQFQPEVSDLQAQESREQGHGKIILHLSSQNILSCLIIKEHMLLTIHRENLFAVQEREFVITIIKKEHERNYGNDIQAAKENVPQVPFTKPDPLRVIPKSHKLFGAMPSKYNVHNAVGNSLSLEILNQLLIYVKGLTKVEKPESELARVSCVEAILVKQWLSVENNFEFELKRFYILKNVLIHLFFCLEVECFAGTRDLEDNLPKLSDECHLKKEQEIISLSTSAKVWSAFSQSDFKGSMTVIMHLFLPWKVEQGTGFNKRKMRQEDIKEEPPDRREHKDAKKVKRGDFTKELISEPSTQEPKPMNVKAATKREERSKDTFQFKERPPDYTNSVSFQGKLLNPYTLQWTNLTYLCVGKQVLRSKLFEEGGYDEDMTSMNLKQLDQEEDGPESLGGDQSQAQTLSPSTFRIIRKTPENVSAQMDLKNDFKNSEINWRTFLAHSESHTKKNQPIISSDEGDTNFTSQAYSSLADSDLCALFGVQRLNQEELSCKPTRNGFLIHERRFESWFHGKPSSHERDINFSSQPDFNQSALNLPALFGEPRLNQKKSGYEINLFGLLTHPRRSGIWNHIKPNPYERVMEFISQGSLHLPYLEAPTFKTLHQRLFPSERPKELRISSEIIPRHSTFMPKLSRLKKISHFPY